MDLSSLRTLVLTLNQRAHGVAATVTRPAPDNTPVSTTGIWVTSREDQQPFGADLLRREPRRVMALPRYAADGTTVLLATMPRDTTVSAPEKLGGTAVTWTVTGLDESIQPDQWRVILER